jgi:tetratricopeptide (TPR) repeat protein
MQADYWADLGSAYEWAGRSEDALRCFERARDLFPLSPDINWRLANFYVRDGKTGSAEVALQRALLGESRVAAAGVRARMGRNLRQPGIARAHDPGAGRCAAVLSEFPDRHEKNRSCQPDLGAPAGPASFFPGARRLPVPGRTDIANEPERLEQAWTAMVERFPAQLRPRVAYPNRIINGGFEFEILNGGLDWRVLPTPGAYRPRG